MNKKILACVVLLLVAGLVLPVAAATIDTSNIRVKKAIADTMTPDELQAYKERLAVNFANKTKPTDPFATRTPADACGSATFEISTLPFGPTAGTTVGATDDYDLPADTTNPTCAAGASCVGGGPAGAAPFGGIYTGTGTGPDFAYKFETDANCALTITMDPTGAEDLSLILYQANCGNALTDCACVSDDGVGGAAEDITLNAVAGVDYFLVVDGYSTGATPPGPSGAFTVSITGAGCSLVPVELQGFSAE